MKKPYILNRSSHIFHIEGYCPSHGLPETNNNYVAFSSEKEVRAYDNDARICKKCAKKRDEKMQ